MTQTLNTVTLVGRVGKDPEIKYFESGKSKATFTLAVSRPTKGKETDWFDLEAWEKTAEIAANYVKKGRQLAVKASLVFENWTDRETGEPRSKPIIRVERLELLGSRAENEGQEG